MDKETHGLTTGAAEKLLESYGKNILEAKEKKTWFLIFSSQFKSFLVGILVIASIVSFFLGDIIDAVFIIIVVIINGVLGFIQEYKAERSLEKLQESTRIIVAVTRDGKLTEIDSALLVPGDIIHLESGDTVPADAELMEAIHCEVSEAVLTGESAPIRKHENDKKANMLFMGTSLTHGRCTARVKATGMHTKFGKIAEELVDIKEDATPLSKAVSVIGKQLTILGIGGSLLVILVGILYKHPLLETVLTGVSLAVAVVPEGLPVIITIVLATGVSRMVKRNATIRKLAAIETLGCVSVIATDKTGTLTKNEMAVKKIWLPKEIIPIEKIHQAKDKKTLEMLAFIALLCNSAELIYKEGSKTPDVVGDKTEGALLVFDSLEGMNRQELREKTKIFDEFSFDEITRSMSMVVEKDGKHVGLVKGAPEMILAKSTHILVHGKRTLLSDSERDYIRLAYKSFANEGLRLIAFGYSRISPKIKKHTRSEVESELVFVGFVGISDPPRPEVKETVELTRQAGIATVMVTGDNEITAHQIGVEIGLIKKGEDVLSGEKLDVMSDQELDEVVGKIRIFARCTPHHKVRITDAFKRRGDVVAVTGDGVNDVLALKRADVGVAMGKGGTDVARTAADMVIVDDNYVTIVSAVEEGRVIFDNLVKSISFLIAGNLSEILTIVLAVSMGLPSPFVPVQILWINIVTDGLPALALAMDTRHSHVMSHPPRKTSHGLIHKKQLITIIIYSSIIAAITLGVYAYGLRYESPSFTRAATFTVMIVLQMLLAFAIRGNKKVTTNLFLIIAVALTLVLQALILQVPLLQEIFHIK